MNRLKNWFKERNNLHYIVAIPLCIIIYLLTFQASQIIGRVIISIVILLFSTISWEFGRELLYKVKTDWNDVKKGLITGIPTILICAIINMINKGII